MTKTLLTKEQVLELDRTLIEAYTFLRELRARSSLAELIHYPSIPAELGESITIHCSEIFFGTGWIPKLGTRRNEGDIILERLEERLIVEVKTTGYNNFQEFKPKDLAADFLVWIHFGDRYINGGGKLHVYILRNPKAYFKKSLRLKLRDFYKHTEGSTDLQYIQAESLQKLLSR
jgi:hypothetical protein